MYLLKNLGESFGRLEGWQMSSLPAFRPSNFFGDEIMPIYEYRCQVCGERFDKLFRSLSQIPAEIECPACQSVEVHRLISAPAIHAGSQGGGDAEGAASQPSTPPVIGRKELLQAQEQKRQLREQVQYEKKEAK
jgi:putative FmdB family regulatory protein